MQIQSYVNRYTNCRVASSNVKLNWRNYAVADLEYTKAFLVHITHCHIISKSLTTAECSLEVSSPRQLWKLRLSNFSGYLAEKYWQWYKSSEAMIGLYHCQFEFRALLPSINPNMALFWSIIDSPESLANSCWEYTFTFLSFTNHWI